MRDQYIQRQIMGFAILSIHLTRAATSVSPGSYAKDIKGEQRQSTRPGRETESYSRGESVKGDIEVEDSLPGLQTLCRGSYHSCG